MLAVGTWMDRSPDNAPDRPVLDGVSVLQAAPGVKRKAAGAPGAVVEGRGGHISMVGTGMVVRVCDESQPERLSVGSLRAKVTKILELRTLWRLYSYKTILGWLSDPDHRPYPQL
jgi:hypothetical protein